MKTKMKQMSDEGTSQRSSASVKERESRKEKQ
jgi:hypothetical protein